MNPPANVREEGNNEQCTEEPPGDPLANVGEEGSNEQCTEGPSRDPLANAGDEGNNERSTEGPSRDPPANVGEEGNISGPSHPVRAPYLSENIAECIGYTKEGNVPNAFHLDAI